MSTDELIKIVKNQIILKKKLETKINELTNSSTNCNQIEEELRNEIEQNKINQLKLQEELDVNLFPIKILFLNLHIFQITRQSLECSRLQNETLKISCQNFQDEISVNIILQNSLFFFILESSK